MAVATHPVTACWPPFDGHELLNGSPWSQRVVTSGAIGSVSASMRDEARAGCEASSCGISAIAAICSAYWLIHHCSCGGRVPVALWSSQYPKSASAASSAETKRQLSESAKM